MNLFYNMDCMDGMKQLQEHSIDMVLCDLPYGVTDNDWDNVIPMDGLMESYRRICKQKANVVLFCQQPFTTKILSSIYKSEYSHMLIWVKNTMTRHKSSKHVPMSQYEEIAVLRVNKYANKEKHKALREYFNNELRKSGLTISDIKTIINNKSAHHYFSLSSEFRIPTELSYRKLQENTGFFQEAYSWVKSKFDDEKSDSCTYNAPQNNSSIIHCDSVHRGNRIHPSQKPIELIERLIKTYSNEGDIVLDNCAGSGTTGIGCINTRRRYVLMEKDIDIYRRAVKRIHEHLEHEITMDA